jgi:hypothetical protein
LDVATRRANVDDVLAAALAAGKLLAEAARDAGVSERTVSRRLAEPDFRARVAAIRAEMIDRAAGRMSDMLAEAADQLRRLLQSRSEGTRLTAIKSAFELALRLHDVEQIEVRLRALEEQAGGGAGDDPC